MEKTIAYLNQFLQNKINDYYQNMMELRPQKGYGYFVNHTEIVQFYRDVYHNIEENLYPISIPEKFPSPNALNNWLCNFLAMLEKYTVIIDDSINHYIEKNEMVPLPISHAQKVNDELREAIEYSLSFQKNTLKERWKNMSVYSKVGFIGSIASIIGLLLYFVPTKATSNNFNINTNNQSPIIQNNSGDIKYEINNANQQNPRGHYVHNTILLSEPDIMNSKKGCVVEEGSSIQILSEQVSKNFPNTSFVQIKVLDGSCKGQMGWTGKQQVFIK